MSQRVTRYRATYDDEINRWEIIDRATGHTAVPDEQYRTREQARMVAEALNTAAADNW